MSDFEMLSIVLMILAIIVTVLIAYIKNTKSAFFYSYSSKERRECQIFL